MAMASNPERYDTALLGILQSEGKIAPFLDVILGFLYRRTDFFRIMKADTDKLGFPPGVASDILRNIFKRYETLAVKDSEKREHMKRSRDNAKQEQQKQRIQQSSTDSNQVGGSDDHHSGTVTKQEETLLERVAAPLAESGTSKVDQVKTDVATPAVATPTVKSEDKNKQNEEDNDEDPEILRQRRELQSNPLTYNGAERDGYFWSQNIMEVDVRVKVPKSVMKGKQVKVDIKSKHIRVAIQESGGEFTEVINNDLTWEVNREDSMWTLVPGEFIHVNLEKRQERWWENVFTDEPKINTRKIDCSRPMTDLDDEAQAKIEEMMFNQRQKQLGLPQSHEMKTNEMLRKAWDAEGSPFKGQPFDPSKFQVDPSSGVVNINQ